MLRWINGFALASVFGIALLPAVTFFPSHELWCTSLTCLCLISAGATSIYFIRYSILLSPNLRLQKLLSSWIQGYFSRREEEEDCVHQPSLNKKLLSRDVLEAEVAALAESFHLHWVAPSFSLISGDPKYSREVKCVFEDTLLNILNTINSSVTPHLLFEDLIKSFTHHCKRYHTFLSKVTLKSPYSLDSIVQLCDEMETKYTPKHPALLDSNGLFEYFKKWTEAILLVHMPEEVSNCPIVKLIIRDLIALWAFRLISKDVCKPFYLIFCILQLMVHTDTEDRRVHKKSSEGAPYQHSLSIIAEERSVDLQDIEAISKQAVDDEVCSSEKPCAIENPDRLPEVDAYKGFHSIGLSTIAENRIESGDKCVASALKNCISTTAGPIVAEPTRFTLFEMNPYSNSVAHNSTESLLWKRTMDQSDVIYTKLDAIKTGLKRSCSYESFLCQNQTKGAECFTFSLQNVMVSYTGESAKIRKLQKMSSFEKDDNLDGSLVLKCGEDPGNLSPPERHEKEIGSSLTLNDLSSSTDTSQALPASNVETGELSPIYEESEDLASSIAKLRSLLTERQSQHSLGSQSSFGSIDSEPRSAQSDPGRYNLEKSRFNFFHKDSSGSLTSVKSFSSTDSYSQVLIEEDLPEASEVPLDGRIFVNISIPSSETHTEANGGQYFLYVIQYDAIYSFEAPAGSPDSQTVAESSKQPETKMILQTNVVKRRFCEFLDLHATIECQPSLKAVLKGIKAPSKWLNLSFSKLDSVSSKTLLLEKYLQSLIQRTELNVSSPVREFLAYGSDSPDMFIKKPVEISITRLDKLLARKVSGVFHSLKTALPSFETGDSTGLSHPVVSSKPLPPVPEKNAEVAVKSVEGDDLLLDVTAEDDICSIEERMKASIQEDSQTSSIEVAQEAKETPLETNDQILWKLEAILQSNGGRSYGTSHRSSSDLQKTNTQVNLWEQCSDCLLALGSVRNNAWKTEMCLHVISNWIGEELSCYIKKCLENICSQENLSNIFDFVRKKLESSQCEEEQIFDDENFSPILLKNTLLSLLPEEIKNFCGVPYTEEMVDLLIGSFASSKLNQELCLNLLDSLLARLVSI